MKSSEDGKIDSFELDESAVSSALICHNSGGSFTGRSNTPRLYTYDYSAHVNDQNRIGYIVMMRLHCAQLWAFFTIFLLMSPFSSATKSLPNLDFCPVCVTFMGQSLTELINIIANIGVVASCTQLCNYLQSEMEIVVCDTLCSGVGITIFVEMIKAMEPSPDPIYICTEMEACQSSAYANVKITKFTIDPPSGARGTKFIVDGLYTVLNQTGTGQMNLYLQEKGGNQTNIFSQLIEDLSVGFYDMKNTIATDQFTNGKYSVTFEICEGTCGSTWPGTKTLATTFENFTITSESEFSFPVFIQ